MYITANFCLHICRLLSADSESEAITCNTQKDKNVRLNYITSGTILHMIIG